jgi:hypothetical protein
LAIRPKSGLARPYRCPLRNASAAGLPNPLEYAVMNKIGPRAGQKRRLRWERPHGIGPPYDGFERAEEQTRNEIGKREAFAGRTYPRKTTVCGPVLRRRREDRPAPPYFPVKASEQASEQIMANIMIFGSFESWRRALTLLSCRCYLPYRGHGISSRTSPPSDSLPMMPSAFRFWKGLDPRPVWGGPRFRDDRFEALVRGASPVARLLSPLSTVASSCRSIRLGAPCQRPTAARRTRWRTRT